MKAKVSLVLGVLVLCLCSVLGVSTSSKAVTEYDYTEYGFENFKPKDKSWETKKFITECELKGKAIVSDNDSKTVRILTCNEYKLIGYSKGTLDGSSPMNVLSWSPDNNGGWWVGNENTLKEVLDEANSESSISYGTSVVPTNFRCYFDDKEFKTNESYLLVFDKNAKSIDGLLYVMNMKDAKKHVLSNKDAYSLDGKGKYKIIKQEYDEDTRILNMSIKCDLPCLVKKGSNVKEILSVEKAFKVKGSGTIKSRNFSMDTLNIEIKNPKNGKYTFKLKTDKKGIDIKFTVKVKGL